MSAANKIYDGNADAITTCSLDGVIGQDAVSCATSNAVFATAYVGSGQKVTATVSLSGAKADQYVLAASTIYTTASITTATVTASISAADKSYDGTTGAVTTCSLAGVIGQDAVSCTTSNATFATAGVGAGKPVTATVSLTGAKAGQYALASPTASTTASIAAATVTASVTAASKTYDGTTIATITNCSLAGVFGADAVSCTANSAAFATAGAGAGKQVTASVGLTGAAKGNYALVSTQVTTSATIAQAAAAVSPNPAGKVYGSADPALTGTLSGFLAADGVTAAYSRTPGENVAGSPYTISATLSPPGVLGNYAITYGTALFTITRATPTVTWANPADITYPTPLSGTQLSASASVPGSFAYTPPPGTVLNVGNGQLLSVLFTPTDNSNYTTASAQAHINVLAATTASCPADPNATLTRAVDDTGAGHGSLPVYTTLQAAYNAARSGDVIGMFSQTIENVTLGGGKSLTITRCTVARITAADSTQPVWNITSNGSLTIIGAEAIGGRIGFRIATNNHVIKSVSSAGSSQYGILVGGSDNVLSVSSVSGGAVGIRVTGDGNDLGPGGAVSGNSDNGVEIGSGASDNTVRIGTIQGNGGHGVQVDGSGNTISGNSHVDSNGLNGIVISGDSNTIKGNTAGSAMGKGNGRDGLKVAGDGNTLNGNSAIANGTAGFDIVGSGNKLKNNSASQTLGGPQGNNGCEYRFADNTTGDQGGNKKDGASFVGTLSGPRYAAGCYR